MTQAWEVLGIAPSRDTGAIRRAYAKLLKSFDPDSDPARFQALLAARDEALGWARDAADEEEAGDATAGDGATTGHPDDDRWTDTAPTPVLIQPTQGVAFSPELRLPDSLRAIGAPLVESGHGSTISASAGIEPFTGYLPPKRASDAAPTATIDARLPAAALSTPVASAPGDGFQVHPAARVLTDIDTHEQQLLALLFPGGEQSDIALTDTELLQARAHLEALLADPALEQIAVRAAAEPWFARMLASACPRADPLLPLAIARFDWESTTERFDEESAISFVRERRRTLDFIATVSAPGHRLSSAWRELTTPADRGGMRRWWMSGARVNELLTIVRRDHPQVENALDPYRVAWWEDRTNRVSPISQSFLVIFGFIALITVRVVLSGFMGNDNSIPGPVINPAYTISAEADKALGPILSGFGGEALTLDLISKGNKPLASDLLEAHRVALRDNLPWTVLSADVEDLINAAYKRGLDHATPTQLSELVRLNRDIARKYQPNSAFDCYDYLTRNKRGKAVLGPEIKARQAQSVRMLLTEVDLSRTAQSSKKEVLIPNDLFGDAAKRAGMGTQAFRNALAIKPDPKTEKDAAQRCTARLALIDAMLDRPLNHVHALLRQTS